MKFHLVWQPNDVRRTNNERVLVPVLMGIYPTQRIARMQLDAHTKRADKFIKTNGRYVVERAGTTFTIL